MTLPGEWTTLLTDLDRGFALLKRLPPAVTFFGGARITPDDPMYALSRDLGRRLAAAGIPPRTGAGPGIMTSVPEGYRVGLAEIAAEPPSERPTRRMTPVGAFADGVTSGFDEAAPDTTRTQGIKIHLPFEPDINEAIDEVVELMTFPIRRLMLYENSLALVVFPGGFGTLDETFEVWSRRAIGLHRDPIIFMGEAFYGPILAAVKEALVGGKRKLVEPALLDDVLVTDDPDRVVKQITSAEGLVGFDERPEAIARRLVVEIPYVAGALSVLPQALTVLGGPRLAEDDPALRTAEVVIGALARSDTPLRIGSGGVVAQTALDLYRAAGRAERVQGFFLRAGKGRPEANEEVPPAWTDRPHFEVTDPIAHKLLLSKRTSGFLALPGDLRTLEGVFSVLCEIQTGKLERRPVVLVGSDFWGPLMNACANVMLSSTRKTIAPADLELYRIVDTPEDALAVLSGI